MARSASTPFTIPSDAVCSDGVCGGLSAVVVDPIARVVTHLVVTPKVGPSRLVPLEMADATTPELRLRCTQAEFEQLEPAEEERFLQNPSGQLGYPAGQVYAWPYYGIGVGLGAAPMLAVDTVPQAITCDSLPQGEIAVRRGDHVHATDGPIGQVQGLVINPADHRMTHVLLQEGHLWGLKQVAIPSHAVTSVTDGIRLNLTKKQVEHLPAVAVDGAGDPLVSGQAR